jgi:hypothetical protein
MIVRRFMGGDEGAYRHHDLAGDKGKNGRLARVVFLIIWHCNDTDGYI